MSKHGGQFHIGNKSLRQVVVTRLHRNHIVEWLPDILARVIKVEVVVYVKVDRMPDVQTLTYRPDDLVTVHGQSFGAQ